MKSIKKSPVIVNDLQITGDISEQKTIVRERWERLKRGDTGFMGYIKKKYQLRDFTKMLINNLKSIWKKQD